MISFPGQPHNMSRSLWYSTRGSWNMDDFLAMMDCLLVFFCFLLGMMYGTVCFGRKNYILTGHIHKKNKSSPIMLWAGSQRKINVLVLIICLWCALIAGCSCDKPAHLFLPPERSHQVLSDMSSGTQRKDDNSLSWGLISSRQRGLP